MSEFVSCPVLTGEVLQETSHWNQRHYLPSSPRSSTTTDLRRPWIQSDRWLPSQAWAPFSSLWSPQLQIAGRFISGPNNSLALLLTCDSLGGELVHLGAGRDRLHTEGVHHQDPPLYLARLLVVVLHGVPDDIVHDT